MPPQKSRAKPKAGAEVNGVALSKPKRAPEIQWSKNPSWTFAIIEYLTDLVAFRLKLFSDLTSDAVREGHSKHVVKDSKTQQYAVITQHVFGAEPGQSSLYRQNSGRYATAVETRLRRYVFLRYRCVLLTLDLSLKTEYIAYLKQLGSTGAGIAPKDITQGSPIANIIGE